MKQVRSDRKPVSFRITRIDVRNVGVLDSLDLDLSAQSITALYAGNGLGKTTVLECMSLLGHLPCFPSFSRESGFKRSTLETFVPFSGCDNFEHYAGVFNSERARILGTLNHLYEDPPRSGATYGFVAFEVEDRLGPVATYNRFAVLVHSPLMQTLGTPRLTDILSRDSSLARNAATLPDAADDRVLGRCGLIVFDPERQSGRTMDDLITAVSRGRTFAVDEGEGLETRRLPHAPGVARSVCYVNTDLNDFGRGNDLRESPKDLDRDFKEQMVDRLEIEIEPQTGCFRYFEELKRAADAVLSTPLESFSDRRVIPPGFDLQNLIVSGDRVGIWIDRRDGQRPVSINFLSAGENEVLFIYLMVLNFTNNVAKGASIILLDEPDLHIANVSRHRFFEEVLRLTDGRAQVIMSTHSPAAYEMFRSKYRNADLKTKVLLRILPHEDSSTTKLFASFDGIYLGRLRRMNYTGGLVANLRHFVDLTVAKIRSVAPVSTYAASAATLTWLFAVLMVVLLTLGAVSNDVLNNDRVHWAWRRLLFFGMSPVRYHDETLRYWLTFGPTSILAPLALLWLRSMSHRRHQKKLERFREAVRARAL